MAPWTPRGSSEAPTSPLEEVAEVGAEGPSGSDGLSGDGVGSRRGFMSRTFDSLGHQEFRWFYLSMLGQMGAMNMQMLVRGYLAFELTGSFAVLGLVGLVSALPMMGLSVFGGVIADRAPKRTVLMIGQYFSLATAVFVALLIFADVITVGWLMVAAFGHGTMMALTMPSRQAMIPEIIGMGRLMNAVSLNMAGMNTMRMTGPALGGFIVSWFGFGWAYLAMACLYGLAVLGLIRVAWRPAAAPGRQGAPALEVAKSSFTDIAAGFRYIKGDRLMSMLLAVSFVSSVFGMPYLQLMPGYVSAVFDREADAVGILISISAIGSLVGALLLASVPSRKRGLLLIVGTMVLGGGLLIFVQTDSYWLAAAFILIIGVGSALRQALSQGLLHSYVENEYRGRVMSVFMLQFSLMQIGTFVVGVVAEIIGVQAALGGLGAGLVIFMVAVILFVPSLRRLD